MKLQNCCAGCSEPFPAKLVQDVPGKGRHASCTESLITSLPSWDCKPNLAGYRKPFGPTSRKLLSATWITHATHVGWVKLSRFQALPTLQLWLIFLSYAHWVLKAELLLSWLYGKTKTKNKTKTKQTNFLKPTTPPKPTKI